MLTLIEILKKSEEYLSRHGIPEARRNAELLVSHVLEKTRLQLYLDYDKPVDESEVVKLRAVLAERKTRKPIQYIFSKTEFFGLVFKVNSNVLIPRPETELLVEEALRELKSTCIERPVVYDIGAGSGCIAVSLAKHCEKIFVYASDVSAEALKIASENAVSNGIADRIQLLLGPDFKPFIDAAAPKADIIVSNPPYIKTADMENLQPEVKDFEPKKALDGGIDGLDVIRRLIADIHQCANAGGVLLMEIGYGQNKEVSHLIEENAKLDFVRIVKDYQGIDRVVVAKIKE